MAHIVAVGQSRTLRIRLRMARRDDGAMVKLRNPFFGSASTSEIGLSRRAINPRRRGRRRAAVRAGAIFRREAAFRAILEARSPRPFSRGTASSTGGSSIRGRTPCYAAARKASPIRETTSL
jgi:hypothetical protein